jgi:hypothetical protein
MSESNRFSWNHAPAYHYPLAAIAIREIAKIGGAAYITIILHKKYNNRLVRLTVKWKQNLALACNLQTVTKAYH